MSRSSLMRRSAVMREWRSAARVRFRRGIITPRSMSDGWIPLGRGELDCAELAGTLTGMRDLDVIDSELRRIAAVRRIVAKAGAPPPYIEPVDQLLHEWITARRHPR
ncbi:MAG: hypothetical protein ACRDTN_18335 [Mycobacterium sp.]